MKGNECDIDEVVMTSVGVINSDSSDIKMWNVVMSVELRRMGKM